MAKCSRCGKTNVGSKEIRIGKTVYIVYYCKKCNLELYKVKK